VVSVLSQTADVGFELIVVNDSGQALPQQGWQDSDKVIVIETNRRERSVARNTGAAVARGRFLHFLDDDDWIADGAYQHLWESSRRSDARWLYGMSQLLDRSHKPTILLRHELQGNCFLQAMAGEWIPLQASMIDRKLFWEVGGFNVKITGPEDIDLQRRILLETDIAETPHLIAHVVLGRAGSTTDYDLHAEQSRWAREDILNSRNAFQRMRASSVQPAWRGRMTRIYLTSAIWNLRKHRLMTASSRLASACLSLLVAGGRLASTKFWHAVFRSYQSVTFARGIEEAQANEKDSR
jgi:glycosyltransferase involved in cell wall biosynthesis